jgi:hypothetical protein
MTGLSRHNVVEEIAAGVDERRRLALRRRAAYIALARAILADDAEESAGATAAFPHGHPAPIGQAATAA